MDHHLRFGVCVFIGMIVNATTETSAQLDTPLISEDERHLAINDPDRFAWMLFTRVNQAIPDDPQGRVVWETWALANDVFADPNQAPVWQGVAAPQRTARDLDPEPLQQRLLRLDKQRSTPGVVPEFSAPLAAVQANETRLNRTTFDFVVNNDLYNIEGQERFFDEGLAIEFPVDAMETKAQWRRIEPDDATRYHTAKSTNPDGTEQLWGLTSLHITTKDLPNWFWCTFEHIDNPGREAVIPDRDSHGRPPELNGTKWENYVLRGSQTNFVDSLGRTTLLASSQIEAGFQQTSSCITCHARATIGERPIGVSPPANRLSVFESSEGSVGVPLPDWFVDASTVPSTKRFTQMDFVWSLFRARRKSAAGPAVATARPAITAPSVIAPRREPIRQFERGRAGPELAQVRPLIRVEDAWGRFQVRGDGLAVAVFDTGLRSTHVDFTGRVIDQVNFTDDNGGDEDDATDGDGHGTNVTGIIAGNGDHIGIAPNANVIPVKVLPDEGSGSFTMVRDGLQWVLDHRGEHNITVVNMSLGDGGNHLSDNFVGNEIRALIQQLRNARVAVVVAAGNDFFVHDSQQGMGFPGIIRETVSVGAVFDANEGGFTYVSGASCTASAADQITPFSQRLHSTVSEALQTDIFAPGAPVTSSGILNDRGESIQHGTSQASPVTSGVIVLMQQFHLRERGELPTVDQLETWLRRGAVEIADDVGEIDNVVNTNLAFLRVDAVGAIEAIQNQIERDRLERGN